MLFNLKFERVRFNNPQSRNGIIRFVARF